LLHSKELNKYKLETQNGVTAFVVVVVGVFFFFFLGGGVLGAEVYNQSLKMEYGGQSIKRWLEQS
jgi:hypothetical protein